MTFTFWIAFVFLVQETTEPFFAVFVQGLLHWGDLLKQTSKAPAGGGKAKSAAIKQPSAPSKL